MCVVQFRFPNTSPRTILESSPMSWKNRFIRAIDAVVRLTSWPYNRRVRMSPPAAFDEIDCLNQHSTGTTGRIAYRVPWLRVEDSGQQVHHAAGVKNSPAFFPDSSAKFFSRYS